MVHKIENRELFTEITIDETDCENTCIIIKDSIGEDSVESHVLYHYLTPKDLSDFIGALLHVQSKKRKGGKNV